MTAESIPLPPTDFFTRSLPIETFPVGTEFHRIHTAGYDPIHYNKSPDGRYNPRTVPTVFFMPLAHSKALSPKHFFVISDKIPYQKVLSPQRLIVV